MEKVLHFVDGVNEWVGRIFCWVVAIIGILAVSEVIMRRFLNAPTLWNFEVTIQLFGFLFMILGAYTLLKDSHVAVDILYKRFSKKKQALLTIISYLIFFFPFCATILWHGTRFAVASWETWERTSSAFAPPIYPIKTVVPITGLLLTIQGLAIFIRKVNVLIGRRSDTD